MEIKEKLRAQVKSKFYYWFWGLATVSVFAGQMYVGSGYRRMAETCLLYTSPSPRDRTRSRMPSSA